MKKLIKYLPIFVITVLLISCGGGGGSSSASNPAVSSVSGAVTSPGGQVAFNPPNTFFAKLLNYFIPSATADVAGSFIGVGAGVTVQLIQIDSSGNQVGSVIGTGVTISDGTYNIPLSFQLTTGANYIVQAIGSDGQKLKSIVTGSSVNVNPVTSATESLVVSGAGSNSAVLNSIPVNTVIALQNNVQALLTSPVYAAASATTASASLSALNAAANANEEVSNVATSIGAGGVVNGIVKDASGTPVAGINIQILDYGNWVLRSETITAADGTYTIQAPTNGNYILGAVNQTTTSTLASQWWTATGGSSNQYSADKLVFSPNPSLTRNFTLSPGVQISGVITGGGSNLAGVKMILRDFYSNEPIAKMPTRSDGTYTLNVAPGKYTLSAVNITANPYATQMYLDGVIGANNYAQAAAINLSLNSPQVLNFSLPAGYQLSGQISDPIGGAQTGVVVRIYDADPNSKWAGSSMESVRSDKTGTYNIWLAQKASNNTTPFYSVESRGQTSLVRMTQNQTAVNFSAAVAKINGFVFDQSGNPVPQAKIFVYAPASTGLTSISGAVGVGATPVDTASNANTQVGLNCSTVGTSVSNPCKMGMEISNSDGSFTVYSSAPSVGTVRLLAKLDNGTPLGSVFYSATNPSPIQVSQADSVAITIGATTTLSANIVMPPGVIFSGTVTDMSGNPNPNFNVQLRGYLGSEDFKCTYATTGGGGYVPANCDGHAASYPTHMFAGTSTRSDGTFMLSVPVGRYYARISNGYSSSFANAGAWHYIVNGASSVDVNTGIVYLPITSGMAAQNYQIPVSQ